MNGAHRAPVLPRQAVRRAAPLIFTRAIFVAFFSLAAVLGPALGPIAVEGGNWPARMVLLAVLLGLWCSGVVAAPDGRQRRPRHASR